MPCSSRVSENASRTGGAVCSAVGVTAIGRETIGRWLDGAISLADDEIGLLCCFDGIGGGRRAFEFLFAAGPFIFHADDEPAVWVVRYAWPT